MKKDHLKRTQIPKKHRWKKAALSVLLTAAMVSANIGSQLGTVMAAEYGSYEDGVFELDGRNICYSIKDAIKNGTELSRDDIEFTNGKILNYRQLFYGENRKAGEKLYLESDEDSSFRIIEFFPEYESGMDVELRSFIRLPGDSGEDYQLTGEEQIILLYLNNSSEDVKCSVKIDGRSKCSITVKSYEAAFGDDEVAIFSKDFNVEDSTADESVEDSTAETTVPSEGSEESGAVIGSESSGGEDGSGESDSAEAGDNVTDDQESLETEHGSDADVSNETDNSDGKEADDADSGDDNSDGQDSDKDIIGNDDEKAEELSEPNADSAAEPDARPMASLSRHNAPVVAAPDLEAEETSLDTEGVSKEQGTEAKAPSAEKSEAAEATEETAGEVGDFTEEKTDSEADNGSLEDTGKADSSGTTSQEGSLETQESSDAAPSNDETRSEIPPEQSGDESLPQNEASESSESQTEPSDEGIMQPDESTPPPSSGALVETLPAETEPLEQKEDTDFEAVKDGKYPLVGIDGCVSAKAYVTPLNKLGVDLAKMDEGFTWQQEMDGGVVIALQADEEASEFLTADVTAEILEISDGAREAIALSAGISSQDVVAYDINLFDADGNKIENEAWNGNVTIRFSGERIEEIGAQSDALAVIHEGSELDGSDTDINAEDLDLQILSTVEIPGSETVSELSGDTGSFSIVGVIPQLPAGDMDVELAWRDIGWPAGNSGDAAHISSHHYYLEINGLPAFCITPNARYPKPYFPNPKDDAASRDWLQKEESFKNFLQNYDAVPMDDLINGLVDPGYSKEIYTEPNLLKASVIIQLGYPEDMEGICWKWANTDNSSPVKDWEPSSTILSMFYQTQYAEQTALTGDKRGLNDLGQQLYDRGSEIFENYRKPVTLEVNETIVFSKADEENIWRSNEFRVNTSEENYSLALADGITAEYKTETGWNALEGEELKAIPKDSVLRLASDYEPGNGSIDINVSKDRIVLNSDKCYFFKAKADTGYQNLMIVDNKEVLDTTGISVSYTTIPDAPKPDESESTVPDTSEPESTVPDTSEPESTAPDTSEPESTAPDTSESESTAPDSSETQPSAPDTSIPDSNVPESTAPAFPDNPGASSGGGGGAGGGGSSSAGRIDTNSTNTAPSGGPGSDTVTLEDLDVPLAELPPSPIDPVEILDEEVPLAALPKTGVKSGAKEVSFILSSVILALYTLVGRKKENKLKL